MSSARALLRWKWLLVLLAFAEVWFLYLCARHYGSSHEDALQNLEAVYE